MLKLMNIELYPLNKMSEKVALAWEREVRQRYGLLHLTLSVDWLRAVAADRPDDVIIATVQPSISLSGNGEGWVVPFLLSSQSLPLRIGPISFGRLILPIAKVYGGDCSPHLLGQGQLPSLLAAIFSHCPTMKGILFDHVPHGETTRRLTEAARGAGFWAGQVFEGIPHYRMVMPSTVDEFKRLRSGDSLKKIRKHERQLAELTGGDCTLMEFRSRADWEMYRSPLERLVASCWQARYLHHGLDMTEVARMAGYGWVRLFVLAAGDKFIAFVLCYQGKDSLIREQSGYDPAYASYYPGEILLHKMVERLYEMDRPAVMDFGVGEGYHKRMVANQVDHVDGVLLFPPGVGVKCKWGLYSICRVLDRGLRNGIERFGIKKKLIRYFKRRK